MSRGRQPSTLQSPSTAPSSMRRHRRGPWTGWEDNTLMRLVNTLGFDHTLSWVTVSAQLGTRSAKQCRERYHQNLKPTLKHTPIEEWEAEIIIRMVRERGPRWAEIARMLNDRSDNAVKNWYNGMKNRQRRSVRRQASQTASTTVHAPNSLPPAAPTTSFTLPWNGHGSQLPPLPDIDPRTPGRTLVGPSRAETTLPSPPSEHADCVYNYTTSPVQAADAKRGANAAFGIRISIQHANFSFANPRVCATFSIHVPSCRDDSVPGAKHEVDAAFDLCVPIHHAAYVYDTNNAKVPSDELDSPLAPDTRPCTLEH
ncbi:hypothetical protein S7711_08723 [Stachybotrys chartarum IBT 7711]|uniref:Uncharacterized protein n=1 Tax=Stachybotrys chartarum (strain CBS 109288 / IBT 7711) TaxID=1280523 RepID=A0A084AKF6_STACB|nr:hypothetical protein S7711_08723 [Stachybotrys chartarum IBT 7711]KFA46613.1 hypothetical protein S40293_08540 [Stachybotrys chartarum IBT 40293]